MVVVAIIGVLAAIAMPNYFHMQERAKLGQCRANQKHISTAATSYAIDQGLVNANITSLDLFTAGLIKSSIAECPNSDVVDNNDYAITITDGVAMDVDCIVEGANHEWELN
ncbi:MAG: hypothetical protein GF355_07145 [Candidatus Eisenbacteria bacterium]|nr:hypothetical protein [Candidatus Eisenbacteria bacterium]